MTVVIVRRVAVVLAALFAVGAALGAFAPSVEARAPKRKTVVYEIRRGDTLAKIAKKFRVTTKQIRRWNRLKSDRIVAGRSLRIAAPVRRRSARLKDPVRMPENEGWYLKNPSESWGTKRTVDLIVGVLEAWREKHPDAPPIVVGDISLEKGGYFPPHRSHRDGRDLDLGLPPKGRRQLTHFARLGKEIDTERAWDLLRAFLDTGEVELVFLDAAVQRRLYKYAEKMRGVSKAELGRIFQWPRSRRVRVGTVRHSRGHADHFHIRFRKPDAVGAVAPPGAIAETSAPAGTTEEVLEGPPLPPESAESREPSFTLPP